MKKLVSPKFTLVLLIMVMISSSCSVSFQKRRYRPGFYKSTSKNFGNNKTRGKSFETANNEVEFEEEPQTIDFPENMEPLAEESIDYDSEIITVEDQMQRQATDKFDDKILETEFSVETEVITDVEEESNDSPRFYKKKRPTSEKREKMNKERKFTKRQLAILIGVSLLLMALIAAFSFPVFTNIFVAGNPVTTGLNLAANSGKFIGSIFGWVAIVILDLLVSWGVYKYYKRDKRQSEKKKESKFDQSKLAGLTGLLRLIYTLFLVIAVIALGLAKSAGSVAQSYNLLSAFSSIWSLGLIVFGLHLIVLGLTYKNEGGRKWFTILMKSLLIIAGIGYMIQNIALLVVPSPVAFLATIESIFMIFMIVGEMAFAIWMLIKGGKAKASNNAERS